MSNVTLHIGGRNYTVACAAGEETHVTGLGELIDLKVRDLAAAGHNEVRILLFAALLLADELHEGRKSSAGGAASAPGRAAEHGPDHGAALEALATRLEKYAATLEG